jgi:hypothetical protein
VSEGKAASNCFPLGQTEPAPPKHPRRSAQKPKRFRTQRTSGA